MKVNEQKIEEVLRIREEKSEIFSTYSQAARKGLKELEGKIPYKEEKNLFEVSVTCSRAVSRLNTPKLIKEEDGGYSLYYDTMKREKPDMIRWSIRMAKVNSEQFLSQPDKKWPYPEAENEYIEAMDAILAALKAAFAEAYAEEE